MVERVAPGDVGEVEEEETQTDVDSSDSETTTETTSQPTEDSTTDQPQMEAPSNEPNRFATSEGRTPEDEAPAPGGEPQMEAPMDEPMRGPMSRPGSERVDERGPAGSGPDRVRPNSSQEDLQRAADEAEGRRREIRGISAAEQQRRGTRQPQPKEQPEPMDEPEESSLQPAEDPGTTAKAFAGAHQVWNDLPGGMLADAAGDRLFDSEEGQEAVSGAHSRLGTVEDWWGSNVESRFDPSSVTDSEASQPANPAMPASALLTDQVFEFGADSGRTVAKYANPGSIGRDLLDLGEGIHRTGEFLDEEGAEGAQTLVDIGKETPSVARDVGVAAKNNPREAAVVGMGIAGTAFIGGAASRGARVGTRGASKAASRATPDSSMLTAANRARQRVGDSKQRTPDVSIRRDADASRIDVDPMLKQQLASRGKPSFDLSLRPNISRGDVSDRIEMELDNIRGQIDTPSLPSRPSFPDHNLSREAARQRLGDAGQRVREVPERPLQRAEDIGFERGQQLAEVEFQAGLAADRFHASGVRGFVDLDQYRPSLPDRPTVPSWYRSGDELTDALNERARRAGRRYEFKKKNLELRASIFANVQQQRVNAATDRVTRFPDDVADAGYRTKERARFKARETAAETRRALSGVTDISRPSLSDSMPSLSDATPDLDIANQASDAADLARTGTLHVGPFRPARQQSVDVGDFGEPMMGDLPDDAGTPPAFSPEDSGTNVPDSNSVTVDVRQFRRGDDGDTQQSMVAMKKLETDQKPTQKLEDEIKPSRTLDDAGRGGSLSGFTLGGIAGAGSSATEFDEAATEPTVEVETETFSDVTGSGLTDDTGVGELDETDVGLDLGNPPDITTSVVQTPGLEITPRLRAPPETTMETPPKVPKVPGSGRPPRPPRAPVLDLPGADEPPSDSGDSDFFESQYEFELPDAEDILFGGDKKKKKGGDDFFGDVGDFDGGLDIGDPGQGFGSLDDF